MWGSAILWIRADLMCNLSPQKFAKRTLVWLLQFHKFSPWILLHGHFTLQTAVHNDACLLRQNGQVISLSRLLPRLLTCSFCQLWLGSPPHPVTLGEWYGLCCVGCTVNWYEKRQLSESSPKNVSPSQLTCWLSRHTDCSAAIFVARLPPSGWQGNDSQDLVFHSASELHIACCCDYAWLNPGTGTCHFLWLD